MGCARYVYEKDHQNAQSSQRISLSARQRVSAFCRACKSATCVAHLALCIVHCVVCIVRCASCIVRTARCIAHRAPLARLGASQSMNLSTPSSTSPPSSPSTTNQKNPHSLQKRDHQNTKYVKAAFYATNKAMVATCMAITDLGISSLWLRMAKCQLRMRSRSSKLNSTIRRPSVYTCHIVNKWWGRCWIPWWTSASRAGSPSWLGHSPSLPSPEGGGNVYTMNWFLCKKHISSLIWKPAMVRRWQSMEYIFYLSMTLFSKLFFTHCGILLLECLIVFFLCWKLF